MYHRFNPSIHRCLHFVVHISYAVYQLPIYTEYVVAFHKLTLSRVKNPAHRVVDRQTCFRCLWQVKSNLCLVHPWIRAVLV